MRARPRILLVQAVDWRCDDGRQMRQRLAFSAYASTALATLAALVPPELDADVRIVDEHVEALPRDWRADLVGISACTPSAPRAYELAHLARERGATAVLGGYHPTALPEEALEHADAVVAGFAEESWPRLLGDWAAGRLRRHYADASLSCFREGLPAPRRELLRRRRYLWPDTVEATRGCAGRCVYCCISGTHLGLPAQRPVEQVIEEIAGLRGRTILFLDPSPTEDLDYHARLLQALVPLRVRWYGAASPRVAGNREWLDLAAASGCRGLLVGFESLNQQSLDESRKGFSRADGHAGFVRELHGRGIAVLGCFVFGFDGDGPDVFERTAAFVRDAGVDIVFYCALTPYPGTALYRKLEAAGRLLHRDWARYDGKHAVFRPARMAPEQLEAGLHWAWSRTHALGAIAGRLRRAGRPPQACVLAVNLGFRLIGRTFIPPGFRAGRHPFPPG